MTIFFTSDTHFGHKGIIGRGYPHRDCSSLDAMDKNIIERWNDQIWHSDQVYILGDLSFYKPPKTVEILQQLRGQKFLIKGNHDHTKNMTQAFKDQFQAIHKYHEVRIKIGENKDKQHICLFHFPIMHWPSQHYSSWHLHGHLHGSPSGVPGKCLDVGWDKHGKLLSLGEVKAYMDTQPVRSNHHGDGGID